MLRVQLKRFHLFITIFMFKELCRSTDELAKQFGIRLFSTNMTSDFLRDEYCII